MNKPVTVGAAGVALLALAVWVAGWYGFLVVGAGEVAGLGCWIWDTRLERRQGQADDGLFFLPTERSTDHDDATVEEVLDHVAAIRRQPDLPLSAPPAREPRVTITPSPVPAARRREAEQRQIGAGWGAPPRPRPEGHGPITREFWLIVDPKTEARERPAWATSVVALPEAS